MVTQNNLSTEGGPMKVVIKENFRENVAFGLILEDK